MSAQLKTLIDRFCAFNSSIQSKHMKSAIITAAWNSDSRTFEALESIAETGKAVVDAPEDGRPRTASSPGTGSTPWSTPGPLAWAAGNTAW